MKDVSDIFRTDILAYKTLTINETDGTPEVSNWLKARPTRRREEQNIRLRPNPEGCDSAGPIVV